MHDAIVIGAGPPGSYVAGQLASCGHKVVVLEQHESIGKTTCCSGIVGRECLDAFPLGRAAVLREARAATFFSPSGECLSLGKDSAQAYIVDRTAFDVELATSAQKQGAEYLLESQVTNVTPTQNAVRVTARIGGSITDFEGRTVVIASGFGTKLPETLGLGKNSDFVMGAQAEVELNGVDEVEVFLGSHVAPGFFAWVVPTSGKRGLAGLLTRHHTGSYLRKFLDKLAQEGKIASSDARISYGGIPLKPLGKTSADRVLVVGDAAGQVKPTTGGGIYYGLLCAQIAADTLHQGLRSDNLSATALGSYDRKWRRLLSKELRTGRWARWAFERLNDRQIEYVFRLVRSRRVAESLMDSVDFSFDWHGRLATQGLRYLGVRGALSLTWFAVSGGLPGHLRAR